ncbi:hypothetical protein ACF05W_02845 [Streptomyces lydicus]|uniref:hypothetical protein n=1 Tax=Streptomyces lydicus TaxID=47763 RepID=UPI0036F83831
MHPSPVVPEQDTWLVTHCAGLLRPGEVVRGALCVRLDPLAPDTPPERYRRPKPAAEEAARFAGWGRLLLPVAAVMYVVSAPARLLERGAHHTWRGIRRLFRGPVWEGGWDSAAGWFISTTRAGANDVAGHRNEQLALVFTDQRLLLLSRPGQPEREAAQLLGEVPAGRFARRGTPPPARHPRRADIAFPDGSWLALEPDDRRQGPLLRELLPPA